MKKKSQEMNNKMPVSSSKIGEFDGYRIEPLIMSVCQAQSFKLASCLDIGCGKRPMNAWFEKVANSQEFSFIGADTDAEILSYLNEKGLDAVNPISTNRDVSSDLLLALEVIEHIKSEDSPSFFDFCTKNTKKIVALTTPNFEYWKKLKTTEETKGCRWVPDHFKDFNPHSNNPHHHKQEMTPDLLSSYFSIAFPPPKWDWRVFRAWPWLLTDRARNQSWTLYFKIFGLAWQVSPSDESLD